MPVQVIKSVEAKAWTEHILTGIPNHLHKCEVEEVPTSTEFENSAEEVRRLRAEADSRDRRMASLAVKLALVAEVLENLGEKLKDSGWLDQRFRRIADRHIARVEVENGKRLRDAEDAIRRAEEAAAKMADMVRAYEAVTVGEGGTPAAAAAANAPAQKALDLKPARARQGRAEDERELPEYTKAAAETGHVVAAAATQTRRDGRRGRASSPTTHVETPGCSRPEDG